MQELQHSMLQQKLLYSCTVTMEVNLQLLLLMGSHRLCPSSSALLPIDDRI